MATFWRRDDDPHNPENRNAGNGGDVVKHVVYATLLDVLLAHEPWRSELRLRECHAGRAVYRLGSGDPRRRLWAALCTTDNALMRAQRRALAALALPDDGSWYAGSAALNATRLDAAPGRHRYEGYEWAPDTRAIARAALADAVTQLDVHLPEGGGSDARFEGEMHIAHALPEWDERDVVLLDPFGLWQRPKLAERRQRYRAILDAYRMLGTDAPPLAAFFVWSHDEAARGDMVGDRAITDGYGELRERLLGGAHVPLLVRWRWDLVCAMWVVVPERLVRPLRERLESDLAEVASAATAAGVGPDSLEVSGL